MVTLSNSDVLIFGGFNELGEINDDCMVFSDTAKMTNNLLFADDFSQTYTFPLPSTVLSHLQVKDDLRKAPR